MNSMFIGISGLDRYLSWLDFGELGIGIYETGSYVEGLADEYSDRDLVVVWKNNIPSAYDRLKIAAELKFKVHEIKDIASIKTSLDLLETDDFKFNLAHRLQKDMEKKVEWDMLPSSELEENIMRTSALVKAQIRFDPTGKIANFIQSQLSNPPPLEKISLKIRKKLAVDLKLLEKSAHRDDYLQFIHYLEPILRGLEILYCVENKKPLPSSKMFEKRFALIENGKITQLIRRLNEQVNISDQFMDVQRVCRDFNIFPSKTLRA